MQKTYKFRLYPNKEGTKRLEWSLEQHRFIYNFLLEQWYKSNGKSNQLILQNLLTELKKAYPQLELYTEHSKSLQYEVNKIFNQLKALRELKKKGHKVGKLRFKSKNRFKSLQYNQSGFKIIPTGTRLDLLRLSKIGDIPMRMHREIDGNIKHVSIKKRPSGKWFVCFVAETDAIIPKQPIKKIVGMDMGITEFLTDTTGKLIENPKYLVKSLKRLRHRQKDLSRTKKKSNNRRKQIIRVARLHEQVANQRNDFCHKVAKHYIDTFDFISVEDLNITGLIKSIDKEKSCKRIKRHMRRNTLDVSWRKFFDILSYKAEWAGKTMVKVNPSYTSQIYKYGKSLDRDYNASLNILERGLKQIGQGLSEFTPLEIVPPPKLETVLASAVVELGSHFKIYDFGGGSSHEFLF